MRRAALLALLLPVLAVAACSPASIGITGPGVQANRPILPVPDDDAALSAPGPASGTGGGNTPIFAPTYGVDGRFFNGY